MLAVAGVAAVAAAFAGCEPTALRVVDVVLTGALAALVSLASSYARRWTWLVVAGLAAVAADTPATVTVAAVALALAVVGALMPRRRLIGALVGGLAVQSLLRLPDMGFFGASALYAAAVMSVPLASAYLVLPRRRRRIVHRSLLGLAAFAGAAAVVFGLAFALAWTGVHDGVQQARDGLAAAGDGDEQAAAALFQQSHDSLSAADTRLGGWWTAPARSVPILGQQVEALSTAAHHAALVADAAGEVAVSANVDEIRYQSGKIDLPRLAETRAPLDNAVEVMDSATASLEAVSSPWLLPPLRSRVDALDQEIASNRDDVALAAKGALALPELLGGDGERTYLVLFTQPAEARGLGGFVGGWAELSAVDGELSITDSGPINELLTASPPDSRVLHAPEDYIARYARFQPQRYLQDVTFSPDMPTVAQVMAGLYPQAGGRQVDGVIVVDAYGLADLMKITGPVSVEGLDHDLNAQNAAKFLTQDQYLEFPDTQNRRDFLELAGRETFDKLVHGSLPGPRKLGDVLGPPVAQRRIMAFSFNSDGEAFFDALGIGGEVPTPGAGDGFMVVTQNHANNKIDPYLERSVDYEAAYDPSTGRVEATATITLHNTAPSSGLPDAVIGSNDRGLPPGTNSLYLSFYTPLRMTGARIDGAAAAMEFQRELGWGVYSQFIQIPAGGTVEVALDLSGTIDAGADYRFTVGAQPTVNPDHVNVNVRLVRPWSVAEAEGFHVDPTGTSMQATFDAKAPTVLSARLE